MENKKERLPVIKDKCYIALLKSGKYTFKSAAKWLDAFDYFIPKVKNKSDIRLLEGEYCDFKDQIEPKNQTILKELFDKGRKHSLRAFDLKIEVTKIGPKLYTGWDRSSGYRQAKPITILKSDLDNEYKVGDIIVVSGDDFYLEDLCNTNNSIGKFNNSRITRRGYTTYYSKLYTYKESRSKSFSRPFTCSAGLGV